MKPFYPPRWSNAGGPSLSTCDENGNFCTTGPVTPVDPPFDSGQVIVNPVPSTGIINPSVNIPGIDTPGTTGPTIVQTTTNSQLVNPNQSIKDVDPVLESAVTPVVAATNTNPPSNWFPGMFGSENSTSGGGGGSASGGAKTNFLMKYKNYLLLAALIGTGIVIVSKNKKSK